MSQAWMIASGKGGVGKSILTASLAMALAKRQMQTVIVDADIGLRSQDMMLGLQNKIVYDVVDVAKRGCKLKYALVSHAQVPALTLLPASQLDSVSDLNDKTLGKVTEKLKKRFSYVLMDAPAGVGRGFLNVAPVADHTLLVVTPDDLSIRDAERVVALLDEAKKPRPMLIVNRVVPALVQEGEMYSPQTVATTLDIPLLGYVPEDPAVLLAIARHETIVEEPGPAQEAVDRICRRFLGEFVPMPSLDARKRWFRRKSGAKKEEPVSL